MGCLDKYKTRKGVASLSFAALFAATLSAVVPANAATATIDINTKLQKISGFGASSAWNSINDVENNILFDTTTGAGLSLLRLRVDESAGTSKKLISSGSNQEQIKIAKNAMKKGAKIWATPWAPPADWQTHPATGKHTFNMDYAPQWAAKLAEYVEDMKAAGVPLIALSAQNEPDGDNFNYMTPEVIRNWIKNHLGPAMKNTGVPIMAPEKVNWCGFKNYLDAILGDQTTADYVPIIAIHEYGCSPAAYPKIAAAGKEFWQTEIYESINVEDAGMNSALNTAKLIHEALVIANVNAWHYWWIHGGHATGLFLNNSSAPTKRVWIMGNYSRFVRPGYKRIEATTAPTSGVTLSAYVSEKEDKISIVVINTNSTATNQTFLLKNVEPKKITPWVTDANNDLKAQSDISISNNGFTYNIPAKSVTTIVIQIGEVEPPPPPGPYDKVISLPGKIEIENYDIGGEGVSYHDNDYGNSGNVYRENDVDIVAIGSGTNPAYAIGYTNAGEWLNYTVNFETVANMEISGNFSSGSDTSSFQLLIDDKPVTDTIFVESTGDWDTYQEKSFAVIDMNAKGITKGEHTLKLLITGSYINLDWLKISEKTEVIKAQHFATETVMEYKVFDMQGILVTTIKARPSEIREIFKQNSTSLSQGTYLLKSRSNTTLIKK